MIETGLLSMRLGLSEAGSIREIEVHSESDEALTFPPDATVDRKKEGSKTILIGSV